MNPAAHSHPNYMGVPPGHIYKSCSKEMINASLSQEHSSTITDCISNTDGTVTFWKIYVTGPDYWPDSRWSPNICQILYGCVCSDEGLTLETSAKHHIPQVTNITISTIVDQTHILSILTHTEKQFFSKLVFQYLPNCLTYLHGQWHTCSGYCCAVYKMFPSVIYFIEYIYLIRQWFHTLTSDFIF